MEDSNWEKDKTELTQPNASLYLLRATSLDSQHAVNIPGAGVLVIQPTFIECQPSSEFTPTPTPCWICHTRCRTACISMRPRFLRDTPSPTCSVYPRTNRLITNMVSSGGGWRRTRRLCSTAYSQIMRRSSAGRKGNSENSDNGGNNLSSWLCASRVGEDIEGLSKAWGVDFRLQVFVFRELWIRRM